MRSPQVGQTYAPSSVDRRRFDFFFRFIRRTALKPVAPGRSLPRVGLGVVMTLADMRLEVGDDRAAHGAGDGAALGPSLEGALEGPLWALAAAAAASGAAAGASRSSASATTAASAVRAAATASPAAPSLGRAPPIIPLSPRHRSSLR